MSVAPKSRVFYHLLNQVGRRPGEGMPAAPDSEPADKSESTEERG